MFADGSRNYVEYYIQGIKINLNKIELHICYLLSLDRRGWLFAWINFVQLGLSDQSA